VATTIADATQKIAEAMSPVTEGLKDWSSETQSVSGALSQTNLELGRHQASLVQSSKSLAEAGVSFSAAATTVRNATDPLSQTLARLTAASEAIQQAMASVNSTTNNLSKNLTATTDATQTSLKSLEDIWVAHSSHFNGIDKSLENAFLEITENLETSLNTIKGFNNDFSQQVGKALTDLGSIVSDLSDTTEDLAKRLK
jgi:chromosome segregation ATPase